MKQTIIAACALAILGAQRAQAEQTPDRTVISECKNLPSSASIPVFSSFEVLPICREVIRTLEGVTADDLQTFEKAAYLFSHEGYETGNYAKITAELVDIIRRRGLYNQQSRWKPTVELAWKAFSAFHGIVTPKDFDELLATAGPMAKTLSDDGLTNMIISPTPAW